MNQEAKRDEGKLQLSLVPTQIIRDIAEVRMYGNEKYGDPNNWKNVEIGRYIDALYRHFLAFLDDPIGVDKESGIPHYKHMACNMAFICHMMKDVYDEKVKVYPCDPTKNTECTKEGCYINGGPCEATTKEECKYEWK